MSSCIYWRWSDYLHSKNNNNNNPRQKKNAQAYKKVCVYREGGLAKTKQKKHSVCDQMYHNMVFFCGVVNVTFKNISLNIGQLGQLTMFTEINFT